MKLFAYLLVLHLGIENMSLPPRREYSVSRLEGTRECNLCDSPVHIRSKDLLQIVSLRMNNDNTPACAIAVSQQQSGKIIRRALRLRCILSI